MTTIIKRIKHMFFGGLIAMMATSVTTTSLCAQTYYRNAQSRGSYRKTQPQLSAPKKQVSPAINSTLAKSKAKKGFSLWHVVGKTANQVDTIARYIEYLDPQHAATSLIESLIPKEIKMGLSLVGRFVPGLEEKCMNIASNYAVIKPLNMLLKNVDENSSKPFKIFKKIVEFYGTRERASIGENFADMWHGESATAETKTNTKKYVCAGAVALDLTRLTAATYNLQQYYTRSNGTQQIPFLRAIVPRVQECAETYQTFVNKYTTVDNTTLKYGAKIVEKLLPCLQKLQKAIPGLPMLSKLGAADLVINLCLNGMPEGG